MLIIEKNAKTKLPKDYHFVNNMCAYIYDHITEILADPYFSEMRATTIRFEEDENLKKLFENSDIHALDALKLGNRHGDLEIVLVKHIVMSIISDMSNFIYESIHIAQKGKMSVAYALTRKPFTDQLLILEQILVDRKDFIDRFFHKGNPNEYDPSSSKIDKREIINKAFLKLTLTGFSPELIYELRYDKSSKMSINWVSNHALHIVTNDKNYRTEDQNLNFVFSKEEDIQSYWSHYFTTIPMLLTYTSSVIDKIVFEIIPNNGNRQELKQLQRLTGLMILLDSKGKDKSSNAIFKQFSNLLITECLICKHKNKFRKEDFRLFFYQRLFLCGKCYNPIQLTSNSFDNLNKIFKNDFPE